MTLEEAIALHQCGLISSTALLYCYLRIRLAPGWKITLHQREISQQLGISKAAFYKGIQRLKDKKLIDWEAPNGVVVILGQNGDSLDKSETVGQNRDSLDKSETSLDKSETSLDKSETLTPSKTLPVKASVVPPDSYQIFIKSLSDTAREKFFNFVREKVKATTSKHGWPAQMERVKNVPVCITRCFNPNYKNGIGRTIPNERSGLLKYGKEKVVL
jgi:hypothetical protein